MQMIAFTINKTVNVKLEKKYYLNMICALIQFKNNTISLDIHSLTSLTLPIILIGELIKYFTFGNKRIRKRYSDH